MQQPDYISELLDPFTPEDTDFHGSVGKGFYIYADFNWGVCLALPPL